MRFRHSADSANRRSNLIERAHGSDCADQTHLPNEAQQVGENCARPTLEVAGPYCPGFPTTGQANSGTLAVRIRITAMALVRFAAPHDARRVGASSHPCVRDRAIGEPCRRWRYQATRCLGEVAAFPSFVAGQGNTALGEL